MAYTSLFEAFSAATADVVTATAKYFEVGDRTKLSAQITAAAISAGNGVFSFEVSNDGINWVTYNRLITNVTKTNAQTDLGVASVTLNSNTSAMIFFPVGDHFRYIKPLLDVTTDGQYSCVLSGVVPGV